MAEYGLDVSMKETAVSIRRDGKRIWWGKCASDPKLIGDLIRKRAPSAKRVVFETDPLSVWFYHAGGRRAAGDLQRRALCQGGARPGRQQDRRQRCRWSGAAGGNRLYREVRVKGFDSMLTRTLVAARTRLVQITSELSNQIGGLMKTFGLVMPPGKGSRFDENVREMLC